MKSEASPPILYPNEKDASFALFHFTSHVDAIEKLISSGINQYSADEIEKIKQTEMDLATKISKNAWSRSPFNSKGVSVYKEKIEVPKKALCCSLAISSPVQEDQLKIRFFDTNYLTRGFGIVMEDPKKVLVPHADYFALNSGGNLPPNLEKKDFLDTSSRVELIKKKDLRRDDASLTKPVRGAFYHPRLPSFPVTNYASYSHESKEVLENKGGERGFFNFARNFYRTSLRGQSKHDKPKWNREISSKYYRFDEVNKKRQEAKYTELLVYQKKGEDNPITGVVLNMDVLRFGKDDLEKLKALFEKNQNLALYIYDSSLGRDFIRKVEDLNMIKSHLDLIKAKFSEFENCFELTESNRSSITEANSRLPVFQNQILKESSAPEVESIATPAIAPPLPKVATLGEDVKQSFEGFFDGLKAKDKALAFLSFLWGGSELNNEYDILKDQLAEKHKNKFTGDETQILFKARREINDLNRQSAIEKLQELNHKEAEGIDKQKTADFVQNYHQIHSELGLDKFLEQDEFELGKKEMLTFVTLKDKSERLKKIDELKVLLEGESKIEDTEILSFFKSISLDEVDEEKCSKLKQIWKDHDKMEGYEEGLKKVARRDFLLLAIDAMEDQQHKADLERHVKINYKETNFLNSFVDLAGTLSAPVLVPAPAQTPAPTQTPAPVQTPAPAPVQTPPPTSPPASPRTSLSESNQEEPKGQFNYFLTWRECLEEKEIKPYINGGALIGGVGGGLIGAGLCVSALGIGAILSTPIIVPVVVGVAVGVAVGVVGGLVAGTIVKNANATQAFDGVVNSTPPKQ